MPRTGRGGVRTGTPGKAYGNRTDLNLPISTVPGQPYGEATDQANAQRAVPMAQSPVSAPAAAVGKPLPKPGSMPYLDMTSRPDEPVTAGIDYGPGPGSEALGPRQPQIGQQIAQAARQSGSEALTNLAALASTMGL